MDEDYSLEKACPLVSKMVLDGWVFSQHVGLIKASRYGIDLTEQCDISDQRELAAAILRLANRLPPIGRISLKRADLRDVEDSTDLDIRFEGPAWCEGDHCTAAAFDYSEVIRAVSDYAGLSIEETSRRVYAVSPKSFASGVPSYHAHIVVSGRNPDASPRYFAVLPFPEPE